MEIGLNLTLIKIGNKEFGTCQVLPRYGYRYLVLFIRNYTEDKVIQRDSWLQVLGSSLASILHNEGILQRMLLM
jgi:hypothetical protein